MAFDKVSYNNDFNKQNYDRITVSIFKGGRDKLKALAKQEGTSVNDVVVQAIKKAYGVDLSK